MDSCQSNTIIASVWYSEFYTERGTKNRQTGQVFQSEWKLLVWKSNTISVFCRYNWKKKIFDTTAIDPDFLYCYQVTGCTCATSCRAPSLAGVGLSDLLKFFPKPVILWFCTDSLLFHFIYFSFAEFDVSFHLVIQANSLSYGSDIKSATDAAGTVCKERKWEGMPCDSQILRLTCGVNMIQILYCWTETVHEFSKALHKCQEFPVNIKKLTNFPTNIKKPECHPFCKIYGILVWFKKIK